MIDRYTKIVLTVIAASLAALALRGFAPEARAAAPGACGDVSFRPCHVSVVNETVAVTIRGPAGRPPETCGSRENPCYVRGGGERRFASIPEPVEVRVLGQ